MVEWGTLDSILWFCTLPFSPTICLLVLSSSFLQTAEADVVSFRGFHQVIISHGCEFLALVWPMGGIGTVPTLVPIFSFIINFATNYIHIAAICWTVSHFLLNNGQHVTVVHVTRYTNFFQGVIATINKMYKIAETCIFSFLQSFKLYNALGNRVRYISYVAVYRV